MELGDKMVLGFSIDNQGGNEDEMKKIPRKWDQIYRSKAHMYSCDSSTKVAYRKQGLISV